MSAPARTQTWAYRTDGSRQKKSTTWRLILVIGMLFTGSINTLSKKAQNSSSSVGLHGEHEKEFKKPWFQTLVMFSGEATVILFWLLSEHVARSRSREMQINETEAQTLIRTASEDPVAEVPTSRLKAFFILGIPACFDLLGTTLAGIGLIYVDASVWQMLRGSIIVFSSVLSVIFLKRKLHGFHWFGVLVCTVGLGAVGTSQLLKGSSSSNLVLGLILIVAGQFVSASQMILEEALLSKRGLKPAQVVGGEGCWGVLLMSCLVLPILYNVHGDDHGSYENALDAITLIGNNKFLLAMVLLYWSSISFYNFFGLSVTKELTAVHRTLIDACRTTVVWVVEIFIYYVAGSHKFGEEWTVYSFLQLGGFALLIFGTMVYNKGTHPPALTLPALPSRHILPTLTSQPYPPDTHPPQLIRLPCFFYPGLEYLPVPAEREEEEEASVYPPLGEAVDGIEGRTSLTKAAKV